MFIAYFWRYSNRVKGTNDDAKLYRLGLGYTAIYDSVRYNATAAKYCYATNRIKC